MRSRLVAVLLAGLLVGAVAEGGGECFRCKRHAVLEEFTNSGAGEFMPPSGVLASLAPILGSRCFLFVVQGPRPPEYAIRGGFETGIDAGKDDAGSTQVSRLTLELWFLGAPRQMIKSWTTLSTLNTVPGQYKRMFENASSPLRQDMPLEGLLVEFEQPPDSCTIDLRGKQIVKPGEEIPIDLKEFRDTQGRQPKPFNRVIVGVTEGKILNGTPWENFPENKVFLLDKDVVTLRYQAPTEEGVTEDTLWVKDACEILPDTVVPMGKVGELGRDVATRKIPIRQGSSARLKVSCDEQIEVHRVDETWETRTDIQRTRKSEYTLSFSLESKPDPAASHGDKVKYRWLSSGVEGAKVTEDETGTEQHDMGKSLASREEWTIHLDATPKKGPGEKEEHYVSLHVDRRTGRPFGVHFPFSGVNGSWEGRKACKGVRRAANGGYEQYDCSHDLHTNGRLDEMCVPYDDACWKIKGDPSSGTLHGGCTRTFKSGGKTAKASYEWEVNAH